MSRVKVRVDFSREIAEGSVIDMLPAGIRIYRQGTDRGLFIDASREEADLIVASLGSLPGVRANILEQF